jgi:hypothetical protein
MVAVRGVLDRLRISHLRENTYYELGKLFGMYRRYRPRMAHGPRQPFRRGEEQGYADRVRYNRLKLLEDWLLTTVGKASLGGYAPIGYRSII